VDENYKKKIDQSIQNKQAIQRVFKNYKKKKPSHLDATFHRLHEKEFAQIDCLKCANCCKTTSPIFRDVDVARIAKNLKMKESKFVSDFLKMDDDGDLVLKSSPCFFLNEDNTCRIYEFRPLACKEYPHTDRKNMHQILDLTSNNSLICPAVAGIVNELVFFEQ
jgi:Fe-S-cluster containining protein